MRIMTLNGTDMGSHLDLIFRIDHIIHSPGHIVYYNFLHLTLDWCKLYSYNILECMTYTCTWIYL